MNDIAHVTNRKTNSNIRGFHGIWYNSNNHLAMYNGMPNNTYNKLMLLTGASLLNSQERSCTTPNISPKNIKK